MTTPEPLPGPRHNEQTAAVIIELVTWENYNIPQTDDAGDYIPGTVDENVVGLVCEGRYNTKLATFTAIGPRGMPQEIIDAITAQMRKEAVYSLIGSELDEEDEDGPVRIIKTGMDET